MEPDMARLARLVQSPEGQQLIQLLQKAGPELLHSAAKQAADGDPGQAGRTLAPLLEDPEVRRLLKYLEGSL